MLLWVSDLDLLQARNYVHADWLRKSEADAVIIVVASSTVFTMPPIIAISIIYHL